MDAVAAGRGVAPGAVGASAPRPRLQDAVEAASVSGESAKQVGTDLTISGVCTALALKERMALQARTAMNAQADPVAGRRLGRLGHRRIYRRFTVSGVSVSSARMTTSPSTCRYVSSGLHRCVHDQPDLNGRNRLKLGVPGHLDAVGDVHRSLRHRSLRYGWTQTCGRVRAWPNRQAAVDLIAQRTLPPRLVAAEVSAGRQTGLGVGSSSVRHDWPASSSPRRRNTSISSNITDWISAPRAY